MALGLCKQMDLDAAVQKAAEKKAKAQEAVPSAEERLNLLSTDESLSRSEDEDQALHAREPGRGGGA